VVATASEGPGELIEDDIDGVLVPVDDHAALSAGINRVLADPDWAAHMGAAGRQVYQEQFTEAVVVARYLEFFRKVAG
ncbi:MAG: glycosyltransferase family 4 protein, partial [Rhodospirillaceae bacterium]|nr:glycosyltransferase family 4 protein [Rhodospirillales bacterium]